MTARWLVAIDPGLTGAIAWFNTLEDDDCEEVDDLPVIGGMIDAAQLDLDVAQAADVEVVLEDQHAMPGNGSKSAFSMGQTFGAILATLAIAGVPVHRVSPAKWKRGMGLTGKNKDASRRLAMELYPHLADDLRLAKHHNRADAVLLGHWWLTKGAK